MKNLFRILNYCMLGVGMFILNNNSCLANEYHPNDYCGYLYVCFICENLNEGRDERDIQQLHFYLSEDGLNWTSVNGKKPAFTAGKDYLKYINESSYNYDKSRVINYGIHSNVYSNEYKEFLLNKKNGRFSDIM